MRGYQSRNRLKNRSGLELSRGIAMSDRKRSKRGDSSKTAMWFLGPKAENSDLGLAQKLLALG